MKQLISILTLGLALAGNASAHGELQAQHGGSIAEGQLVTVELVAQGQKLTVYLTDHDHALPSQGGKGEVIVLSGGVKSTVSLTAAAGNSLTGSSNVAIAPGAKAIVKISLPGKGDDQVRLTTR